MTSRMGDCCSPSLVRRVGWRCTHCQTHFAVDVEYGLVGLSQVPADDDILGSFRALEFDFNKSSRLSGFDVVGGVGLTAE
jgi:hypothetical protein